MTLMVYNALSRQKETFKPLTEGRVYMYVCGPTVYDHAHVGHAKTYVSFDVMVRYLRWRGYTVRYVQNITDVGHLLDSGEDRILKRAARERVEPMELVEIYMRSYFEDMDALGVQRPDISPRAAAHIPEQIEMVETLLEKSYAYEVDGSVYFDVSSFGEYGKLSGRKVEELTSGTREVVRTDKRSPEDFALWKRASADHILQWNSPWGRGYPGWHVECSAMAHKYLGENFDIHGGGVDNVFPHNECEIAQSEAANGKPFANYWLLIGSLTVEGVKMSKSLGNFIRIKDALKKYRPEAIRMFILNGHYRKPVDFSEAALDSATKGWERLLTPLMMVRERLARGSAPDGEQDDFAGVLAATREKFIEAMDDDFNATAALAVLFDFNRELNKRLNGDTPIPQATLEAIDGLYGELAGDVLGLIPETVAGGVTNSRLESDLIRLLIDMRTQARANKDFAAADSIRDRLANIGVMLEDGRNGTTWKLPSHS